jgi:hypothetical protein
LIFEYFNSIKHFFPIRQHFFLGNITIAVNTIASPTQTHAKIKRYRFTFLSTITFQNSPLETIFFQTTETIFEFVKES